jgi:hypothetical protein
MGRAETSVRAGPPDRASIPNRAVEDDGPPQGVDSWPIAKAADLAAAAKAAVVAVAVGDRRVDPVAVAVVADRRVVPGVEVAAVRAGRAEAAEAGARVVAEVREADPVADRGVADRVVVDNEVVVRVVAVEAGVEVRAAGVAAKIGSSS